MKSLMKLKKRFLLLLALVLALCLPGVPHVMAYSTQPVEKQQLAAQHPQMEFQIDGITGLAGWYRSSTTVSVNVSDAASGVVKLEMRGDDGDWQPVHSIKLAEDGIHPVHVRVTDANGNQTTISKEVKIDQHDPIGQFISPQGGTAVRGAVMLTGTVHDALSGMGQIGVSQDDGKTWQTVPLHSDGSWSVTWDTRPYPDGMHALQTRFTDQAGNTSSAEIFYIVTNHPAQVHLTPRWEVSDKGELDILPGDTMLMDVTIDISDPKGRWPDVHLDYSPRHTPKEITWDGKFGETLAPSGEYNVTVKIVDQVAQQTEAHAVIVIPPLSTPQPFRAANTQDPSSTAKNHLALTLTRPSAGTATGLSTPAPPITMLASSPWVFLFGLILLAGSGGLVFLVRAASRKFRP